MEQRGSPVSKFNLNRGVKDVRRRGAKRTQFVEPLKILIAFFAFTFSTISYFIVVRPKMLEITGPYGTGFAEGVLLTLALTILIVIIIYPSIGK